MASLSWLISQKIHKVKIHTIDSFFGERWERVSYLVERIRYFPTSLSVSQRHTYAVCWVVTEDFLKNGRSFGLCIRVLLS